MFLNTDLTENYLCVRITLGKQFETQLWMFISEQKDQNLLLYGFYVLWACVWRYIDELLLLWWLEYVRMEMEWERRVMCDNRILVYTCGYIFLLSFFVAFWRNVWRWDDEWSPGTVWTAFFLCVRKLVVVVRKRERKWSCEKCWLGYLRPACLEWWGKDETKVKIERKIVV